MILGIDTSTYLEELEHGAKFYADGVRIDPLDAFLENSDGHEPFITVLQQEKNLSLMLTRERLCGAVYTHLSQRFYLQYMRQEFPGLENLTDEELMAYYDEIGR